MATVGGRVVAQSRETATQARNMNKQAQHHSLAEGARVRLLPGVGPFMHHNAGLDSGEVATKPGEAAAKEARKPTTKPHVHAHRTTHVCVHCHATSGHHAYVLAMKHASCAGRYGSLSRVELFVAVNVELLANRGRGGRGTVREGQH